MYFIVVQVRGLAAVSDADRFPSLLNEAKVPEDGMEHVYVETTDYGVLLGMFMVAPTVCTAQKTARRLCDELLSRVDDLAGCTLGQVVGVQDVG
jgi:hypothetical protein